MQYYVPYFAQAYGEDAYGAGSYSCTEEQEASGVCTVAGTGSGSDPGGLITTGTAVLVLVTAACLIMFVALVVRIWSRPKPVPQEAEPEETGPAVSVPGRPDPPSID